MCWVLSEMKLTLGAVAFAAVRFLRVTAGIWRVDYNFRLQQQADEKASFEADAARAFDILSNRIVAVLNLLDDTGSVVAQSFVDSGSSVAAFDRFVTGGERLVRHPEMDAVAFMGCVQTVRADIVADQINQDPARLASDHGAVIPRPATDRDHRVVFDLIHPIALSDLSEQMAGFDLMVTPRANAIERAIQSRFVAASGKITLFGA